MDPGADPARAYSSRNSSTSSSVPIPTSARSSPSRNPCGYTTRRPRTSSSGAFPSRFPGEGGADSFPRAHSAITFVPGLYKIVDEILVNAADNKVRDANMKNLKVTIDVDNKTISVYNDGKGIPIEMHATEGIWIPELIFGQLLTSSNYDDDEAKVTGGRNGYGAKLANIYSTEFIVETACSSNGGKVYKQVFSDNMGKKGKPKITDQKKEKLEVRSFLSSLGTAEN